MRMGLLTLLVPLVIVSILYYFNATEFMIPVIIGKNGWEKIVDVKLTEAEQAAFNKSADAVRSMNDVLKTL